MKRKPLPPRSHEHDLRDLTLVTVPATKNSTAGRVVLFLFRKCRIDADDDVIHRREFAVRALPHLPPVAVEDAAFVRHWRLLQSSAGEVRAEFSLDARDFSLAKSLRPHQRALTLSMSGSGSFSPLSSRPRGSCQPSTVRQCRRCSYCIGIIRWHQSLDHSLLRICPLTSSSCSRCMMTMSGDCLGLFRRVVESSFHQVRAVLRSASLSASSVLWGSSTTMMSPPMPSNEPPTDVASLEPPTEVSNFVFVFWSSRKLKRCPHSD